MQNLNQEGEFQSAAQDALFRVKFSAIKMKTRDVQMTILPLAAFGWFGHILAKKYVFGNPAQSFPGQPPRNQKATPIYG